MHLDLERREHLGTALNLIPGFPLPAHEPVQQAAETLECNSATDLLIIANTENWFARHAEHCLKRITWSGPISDWSEQLHQHLDRFEKAAVGADGGPGMWITRAQMDFLTWQTKASSGTTPCQTRLFVATMYLLHNIISYTDGSDQSPTFVEVLKSKYPSLHESMVAALHELNIDEVLQFVDSCPETEDVFQIRYERDYLKNVASTIKERILSLADGGHLHPKLLEHEDGDD